MGSGKKFRIDWMPRNFVSIGMSIVYKGEHDLSIHFDLIKIQIYIGFGKGYDE